MGIGEGTLKKGFAYLLLNKGSDFMDVMKAIKSRRSIRAYKNTEVEEEKLKLILEAARLSPSARNLQNWKFIAVRDKVLRGRLVEAAAGQKFVGEAPVTLVACATAPERIMTCGQPANTIDLSIALSYMMLEATELGLGTCWLGSFYEDKVKEVLNLPESYRVVAVSPLGYPSESPEQRPRKSIEEIVEYI